MTAAATLKTVSGSTLIARLSPLKRILCLYPVETTTQGDFVVGLAVSDPYLSRASPIPSHQWKIQLPSQNDTFPPTLSLWRKEMDDYLDIGAIALALPMNQNKVTIENNRKEVRHYILSNILQKRYLAEDDRFVGGGLICDVNDQISWEEAQQLAHEDPEMWEELLIDDGEVDAASESMHAYVALNHFLWNHTGGWQNTFG